ncbi:MAG: hypothetical protein J7L69_09370 [Desulfobulbaceae bacterium]|nr:hypothetical protein [Desulfobulbaceae bacterium]
MNSKKVFANVIFTWEQLNMKNLKLYFAILSICMFCSVQAQAVTLSIGDADGFGYGKAEGFVGVDKAPAERAGDRAILDMGDLLPDLNGNGFLGAGGGDDFDNQSAAEKEDTGESSGQKWTDVSLSESCDESPGLADDAVFVFRFDAPVAGETDYGRDHFINLVHGDYDVDPMTIEIEGKVVDLVGNQDPIKDGFISRAYATVSWDDMKDGEIVVNVVAPNEPYVAFDYILLDVTPLSIPNPNPTTMFNLLLND